MRCSVLCISRRSLSCLILAGCLALSIFTVKHFFCIEEPSCLTSMTYFRDTLLQQAGLAFIEEPTTGLCEEYCDKTIIMGHRANEDASWVVTRLPDWQHAIYNVDLANASLGTQIPKNKGHEAMVYLTYIIENYDTLPSIMLFIHAHENGYRKAWHVDAPLHDQVYGIRTMQLDYIRQQGYVNLRCMPQPGCDGTYGAQENLDLDHWNQIFNNTSTPPGRLARQIQGHDELAKSSLMTNHTSSQYLAQSLPAVRTACCAQFAVIRESIQLRPRSDYVAFREWLLSTTLSDADSGRNFEYLWHIIFGKPARLCPDSDSCYCSLYGKC